MRILIFCLNFEILIVFKLSRITKAQIMDADIYEDMRHRLITGEFGYGTKLRAEKLRLDYGCSASTVREVLFRLSTVGLVQFQEQRGFRAPEQCRARQHDLTHMRILLEQEGACLSARLGDLEWEARLAAAHHKLSHIELRVRSSGDVVPLVNLWSRAEQEFHETLMEACGSPLLKQMHLEIYQQFRQQLVSAETNFGYFPENIEEHQAILKAALDRDEKRLRAAIHDHLARNLSRPLPRKAQVGGFAKSSLM
jgi:DNA-binding GntR family transcriptional regulator